MVIPRVLAPTLWHRGISRRSTSARSAQRDPLRLLLRQTLGLVGLLGIGISQPSSAFLGECVLRQPESLLRQMELAARRQIENQAETVEALLVDEAKPGDLATEIGELGRDYHTYGLEDSAAACYREAERLSPDSARWPYYLGFLHQVRGEAGEAAEAFERALLLTPDDPPTLVRLAQVRLQLGELESSENLFRRSLERHPSTAAAAHAGLARIAAARGQHAAAVENFEAALALQPQATLLHYPLALAYRQLGQTARFEEHLRLRGDASVVFPDPLARALDSEAAGAALHVTRAGIALAEGRREEAVTEYRLALAIDPGNASARYDLGLLLAAGGDLAGAQAELEEARRLLPDDPSKVAALARVLAAGGAEEEALPLFRQAVELDPDWADGHLQLAASLARSGRYPDALAAFDRVLELGSQSSAARLGRAEVLLELGREGEAAEELEAVLRGEPDNSRASLRLGEARQRLGEAEAALAAFEAAIGNSHEPTERAAALLGAANLHAGSGDLDAAIDRYREALDLVPGLDEAEFNLAGALTMIGREEEALRHYSALLTRDPANGLARTYRADTLLRLGRAEEAFGEFAEASARQPTLPHAHLGAAAALVALGRWSEARSRLESSLEKLPGEWRVANALARLLASSPEPEVRDGDRALQLALALMAAETSPAHAETLAMALAAAGRFEEATAWQREILAQARAAAAPEATLARLQSNLELYESGSPCCAAPAPG